MNPNNARGQETPFDNHEASDGTRLPRSAAASGRLVSPAPDRCLSIVGYFGLGDAALDPHAANSDGDTAIEFISKVVTRSVLVQFGRQRWAEIQGLRRPCFFCEASWAVYSVQGVVWPRAAPLRWRCSGHGWISPLKQSMIRRGLLLFHGARLTSSWTDSPNRRKKSNEEGHLVPC